VDHAYLEQICLQLKGTTTDIKWGNDLCYLVGGKMYCVASLEPPLKVSLKVDPGEFGELIGRLGIIPAPYMARNHWILVEKPESLSFREWKYYVEHSYKQVRAKLTRILKDKLK
jgi:predicted DNA-binding protein (MmcQ/YjbR family)